MELYARISYNVFFIFPALAFGWDEETSDYFIELGWLNGAIGVSW